LFSSDKVFVTGYARLPQGITATELYKVVGVGLTISKQSGVILDADCSLVTRTGKEFFKETVKGHNINEIELIVKQFERNYLGHAKRAIITALRTAHKRFDCFRDNGFIDIESCHQEALVGN
jgi:hypothetical protein